MPAPHNRTAAQRAAARRPVPFTFQCAGCEVVQHRPTPALPAGWITIAADDDLYAYCGGCAPQALIPQEPLQ